MTWEGVRDPWGRGRTEIHRSWGGNQRGEVRDPERGRGTETQRKRRGAETALLFFKNSPVLPHQRPEVTQSLSGRGWDLLGA